MDVEFYSNVRGPFATVIEHVQHRVLMWHLPDDDDRLWHTACGRKFVPAHSARDAAAHEPAGAKCDACYV